MEDGVQDAGWRCRVKSECVMEHQWVQDGVSMGAGWSLSGCRRSLNGCRMESHWVQAGVSCVHGGVSMGA